MTLLPVQLLAVVSAMVCNRADVALAVFFSFVFCFIIQHQKRQTSFILQHFLVSTVVFKQDQTIVCLQSILF